MDLTFNYRTISTLTNRAIAFAGAAHADHKRKYSNLAYISHPLAVMSLHETILPDHSSPEVLSAAVLHDTVEDTEVTMKDIIIAFGHEVAEYVNFLTKISVKGKDGNRNARNAIDRAHFAEGPAQSQNIKLFDVYHNASDIIETNPRFGITYLPECVQTIQALDKCDEHAKAQVLNLVERLVTRNLENYKQLKEAKKYEQTQTQPA